VIKILVEYGADINQRKTMKQGPQNALELAKSSGYKLTEKILKDLGAIEEKVEYDINHYINLIF
jgi:hypothetical protein